MIQSEYEIKWRKRVMKERVTGYGERKGVLTVTVCVVRFCLHCEEKSPHRNRNIKPKSQWSLP